MIFDRGMGVGAVDLNRIRWLWVGYL